MTGWCGLFYLFGALLLEWERTTALAKGDLTLGLTAALLTSAWAAPVAGRLIDAGHGRWVMGLGALVGAAALAGLSAFETRVEFILAWAVIGIAQAACLYEPCFAVIARAMSARAGRAIAGVATVGGLCTLVTYPLAGWLVAAHDWQTATLAFAALTALVTAPLMFAGGAMLEPGCSPRPRAERRAASCAASRTAGRDALARARGRRAYRWLFLAFGLIALPEGLVLAHMVPALVEAGQSETLALALAALLGPVQVLARLLYIRFARPGDTAMLALWSYAAMGLGTLMLAAAPANAGFAVGFALLFGLGYGVASIAKPMIVVRVLGAEALGRVLGALAVPWYLVLALSPHLGSVLWSSGGYDLALVAAALAAMAATLALATALAEPDEPARSLPAVSYDTRRAGGPG